MRASVVALALAAAASGAQAQSLHLAGKAGYLQEWELSATVAPQDPLRKGALSGPLTLKHVGICSAGGAEEKSGEIRLETTAASRITAKLTVDGAECAFSGTLSEASAGVLECPGIQGVPMSLWAQ